MKKLIISKLFLYKNRFIIGYILLALAFLILLFALPQTAQTGLSDSEIESATNSFYLGKTDIVSGNLVDLPYRLIQKLSILIFGLSSFSIKLPSIIIGLFLGFLLVLLLNRWFKNNVSILSSTLIILSTPFLFLAGSGTPLIMLVFWPTLLLWLGSKIQGENKPKPSYCFLFAIALLLSIFTPFMVYFAIFCVVFVLIQPHLRFVLKNLPKIPLILTGILIIAGITALLISIIKYPETIKSLLFTSSFDPSQFFTNIGSALALAFSWHNNIESVFLTPLISLPLFAIALIGLFSTTKGFFASRNSIASIFIVFTLILSGFNPDSIVFLIIPLAILVAHGLKYILEKWYGLFPENPYARVSAFIPLALLFCLMIIPSLAQYFYGYHYNPSIADQFSDSLSIIRKNLSDETLIVPEENLAFYQILDRSTDLTISSNTSENPSKTVAYLGKPETIPENYELSRIITSAKRDNSDIIYLYTKKGE